MAGRRRSGSKANSKAPSRRSVDAAAPRPAPDEAEVTGPIGELVESVEDVLTRAERALARIEPVLVAAKVVVLHVRPASEADARMIATLRNRLEALEATR